MAAWVVRCGRKGQEGALARFEDNSVASIGWEIGDLSQIDSREDIKKRLWEVYPESSDNQVNTWTGIIYRFAKEIAVGDLIVTPSTRSSEVLIGRCEGAYEYWPQWESLRDGTSYEDVRRVNWRKKVARAELSGSLRQNLRSMLTVSKIKEQNIHEILTLVG
jgi:restriction system protein